MAGEDLAEAAAREVLEETGVRAEFVSLLAFRHMHGAAHACSDLYFICVMRPLTREISMCTRELAACQWMPVSGGAAGLVASHWKGAYCGSGLFGAYE